MTKIPDDAISTAMNEGEFPADLTGSARRAALILTQSWCGDWLVMKPWLTDLEGTDTAVYYAEYDLEPWFDAFRTFKENRLGSHFVPYIRYYENGVLTGQSHGVGRRTFERHLGLSD